MTEQTIRVFWKDKFEGQAVTISAGDYNPALHRHQADGPWGAGVGLESPVGIEAGDGDDVLESAEPGKRKAGRPKSK